MYLEQQENLGVARLRASAPATRLEAASPSGPQGRNNLALSPFLAEEARPAYHPARCHGYYQPLRSRPKPAPPKSSLAAAERALPAAQPLVLPPEALDRQATAREAQPGWPPRRYLPPSIALADPCLTASGFLMPWATEAGAAFSLAPLVAAVWAREGASEPIPSAYEFDFTLAFAWPAPHPRAIFEIPAEEKDVEDSENSWDAAPLEAPPAGTMPDAAPPIPPEDTRDLDAAPLPPLKRPKLAAPRTAPRPFHFPAIDPQPSLVSSARAARHKMPARRFDRDEFYELVENPLRKRGVAGEGFGWQRLVHTIPGAPTMVGVFSAIFLVLSAVALISVPRSAGTSSSGGSGLFAGGGGGSSFKLENLRSAIRNRASLRLVEDFRSGLSGWFGPGGWSKDWSYDQAGFLRPGKIGLLRQSMPLTNYRMEFLGQIERKSLGWVFRASDPDNYYAAKITITKPGPLPTADLVRFAVTAGQPGPRSSVSLPFSIRNDTIYQVQMEVKGDSFSARVNGQMVDAWTDNRFRTGGVGFMSEQGDLARVRWLRVSDRDDFIGRICSYLSARAFVPPDGVLSATSYPVFLDPTL
ncbi:MAG: hypothetical protein HY013_03175 [Candidatus Solibacter usitatus]|nr:hypothetical protein [Candidatus Solibacter usitatus]